MGHDCDTHAVDGLDHFPSIFFVWFIQVGGVTGADPVITEPLAMLLKSGQVQADLRAGGEESNQVVGSDQGTSVVHEERLQ
jgi:hypothetical protein